MCYVVTRPSIRGFCDESAACGEYAQFAAQIRGFRSCVYVAAAAEDELREVAVVDLISAEMSVDRGNDLASEVVVVRDTFEE